MPEIAELKEIDGEIWARVRMNKDDGGITLWTESEKSAALARERNRCMYAIEELSGK